MQCGIPYIDLETTVFSKQRKVRLWLFKQKIQMLTFSQLRHTNFIG